MVLLAAVEAWLGFSRFDGISMIKPDGPGPGPGPPGSPILWLKAGMCSFRLCSRSCTDMS